jgi:leucyl aminopeptidase
MDRTLVAVRARQGGVTEVHGEVLVVPVTRGPRAAVKALGRRLGGGLERRVRATGYAGKEGESLGVDVGERVIVLVGAGASGRAAWRRFGARARREMDARRAKRGTVFVPAAIGPVELGAVAEGLHLAGYRFAEHRRDERPSRLMGVLVLGPSMDAGPGATSAVAEAATVARFVLDARDLVNEPPSVATPSHLAAYARSIARGVAGLSVEVWDAARMKREGVAGVLAVARGAKEPPRFIVMRYRPKGAERHVALVGKGITFDSGGLSLKTPKSMETMKYDMAGAAAVLATVGAVATLGLPVRVTGFVPATENLPGQAAQKPGDVIRYANGKTVEVLNTDAEGRLVLADGLILASREKPDAIVDLATLTGAARVALGVRYAAVMGNDQPLIGALSCAGEGAGERLWQLPLAGDVYGDDIKGAVADLRNVGQGPEAGTIVAGLFLEHFVDGAPWAHLDIAGPAFAEKDWPECPRGGSGFGVRLLVEYLRGVASA